MVELAQLVRASDCGSEGRGFEPHIPPHNKKQLLNIMLRSCFCVLESSCCAGDACGACVAE